MSFSFKVRRIILWGEAVRSAARNRHKRVTQEMFIARARELHGDKYGYSKTDYQDMRSKVLIVCPRHGEFWQRAQSHLSGNGCLACKRENHNGTTDNEEVKLFLGMACSRDFVQYIAGQCSGAGDMKKNDWSRQENPAKKDIKSRENINFANKKQNEQVFDCNHCGYVVGCMWK